MRLMTLEDDEAGRRKGRRRRASERARLGANKLADVSWQAFQWASR